MTTDGGKQYNDGEWLVFVLFLERGLMITKGQKHIEITAALLGDEAILTSISFAAKRVWKYPEEYFQIWKSELTITPEYLRANRVRVCRLAGRVVGYYSLVHLSEPLFIFGVELAPGYWLDHMFVQPEYLHQGVGTAMMNDLFSWARASGLLELHTLADPNAVGFYRRLGWQYLEEIPSSIAGRTTPHFCYRW